MKKRIIAVFLCLALIPALLPSAALAWDCGDQTIPLYDSGYPLYVHGDGWRMENSYTLLIQSCCLKGFTGDSDVFNYPVVNHAEIAGGAFAETVDNRFYISGGTFYANVINYCDIFNASTIGGGTFFGEVRNQDKSSIEGGYFLSSTPVENNGKIKGGVFLKEPVGYGAKSGYTVLPERSHALSCVVIGEGECAIGSETQEYKVCLDKLGIGFDGKTYTIANSDDLVGLYLQDASFLPPSAPYSIQAGFTYDTELDAYEFVMPEDYDAKVYAVLYTPVENITGVPSKLACDTEYTLSGTVYPSSATNRSITWSVKNAGETGAVITDGKLTASKEGTAIITATVENGQTKATDYTQDFEIIVYDGAAVTLTLKLDGIYDFSDQALELRPLSGEGGSVQLPALYSTNNYRNKVPSGSYLLYLNGRSSGRIVTVADKAVSETLYFYTVSFNDSTATTPMAEKTAYVLYNSKLPEPDAAPLIRGHAPLGWYTTSDCAEGEEWDFESAYVTAKTTLYPKWPDYAAFVLNGTGCPAVELCVAQATDLLLILSAYNKSGKLLDLRLTQFDAFSGTTQYDIPDGFTTVDTAEMKAVLLSQDGLSPLCGPAQWQPSP